MQTVKLETKRMMLEGLNPANMNFIFENFTVPEIKKRLGHRSDKDFLREENKYKNGYASYNRSFMLFLLSDKNSGEIIGSCGFHTWNAQHRRAEIGYIMEDERYKRKGLMSEALGAILEYGFDKMNLHRIEALVGEENAPSLRLLEKYHFTREGLLRQHYFNNEKFEDSVMFSLLFDEHAHYKNRQ